MAFDYSYNYLAMQDCMILFFRREQCIDDFRFIPFVLISVVKTHPPQTCCLISIEFFNHISCIFNAFIHIRVSSDGTKFTKDIWYMQVVTTLVYTREYSINHRFTTFVEHINVILLVVIIGSIITEPKRIITMDRQQQVVRMNIRWNLKCIQNRLSRTGAITINHQVAVFVVASGGTNGIYEVLLKLIDSGISRIRRVSRCCPDALIFRL